jgi:hypothetical protein
MSDLFDPYFVQRFRHPCSPQTSVCAVKKKCEHEVESYHYILYHLVIFLFFPTSRCFSLMCRDSSRNGKLKIPRKGVHCTAICRAMYGQRRRMESGRALPTNSSGMAPDRSNALTLIPEGKCLKQESQQQSVEGTELNSLLQAEYFK